MPGPHAAPTALYAAWFDPLLKMSLEKVLIALRDDAALRHDPARLLRGGAGGGEGGPQAPVGSLYPDGFSAQRFVEVIETGPVWAAV